MLRIYLYLASRSKDGIKLITTLQGTETVNSLVTNLKEFQLPQIWERKIAKIIYDNRMLYEPRVESAKTFEELKSRLRNRGFTGLPMGAIPLLDLQAYAKAPVANTSSCQVRNTMLRKRARNAK